MTETISICEETIFDFDEVAMLPQHGDNAAVAKRLLPKGNRVALPPSSLSTGGCGGDGSGGGFVTLSAPCLEGHRFAILPAGDGSDLLSWGLPFGHAVGLVGPGDVLLNAEAASALRGRLAGPHGEEDEEAIRTLLRAQPVNFVDLDVTPDHPFVLEERGFTAVGTNRWRAADEVGDDDEGDATSSFLGYRRSHGRGVGTRNHVAVVALTASASPMIATLRSRWSRYETERIDEGAGSAAAARVQENFDGVRIVVHTEGESASVQHNEDIIHRCLAGFLRHPNVGAAVVVTTGRERYVTRDTLMEFVRDRNEDAAAGGQPSVYPDECFREPFVRFVQASGGDGVLRSLDEAVEAAVDHATHDVAREPCPLSDLCAALQCGGSDSFSGLCGNPLAGEVAARLIERHGGRAILAESPELVGAEPYVLSRVADEEVARRFIETTERYKEYGARHGLSVAGNPSGGNLYRGLYNIVLKSLGAARKKPPSISLDVVLEYGEPMASSCMEGPKYAFMDSPGNDLESIAGQVASGCNIIIFITGNGSMTNFPFVPTIKVVTTEKRYELIKDDMDVNAGPYGHGGAERLNAINGLFDMCVRVSSGERSKGEGKGHSQVSLWRNFAVGPEDGEDADTTERLAGCEPSSDVSQLFGREDPHEVRPDLPPLPASLLSQGPVERGKKGSMPASVLRPWSSGASFSLIPTSLCSSAVATAIADSIADANVRVNHIVCPSHTEGCGAAGDEAYNHRYERLMIAHALHPTICRSLFLEHGCEKTHNDYFRTVLKNALKINDASELSSIFGFWSLQGGGGFDNAKVYASEYFRAGSAAQDASSVENIFILPWSSRPVSVGIMVDSLVATSSGHMLAPALGSVVRFLAHLRVHTVLPVNSPLITFEGESIFEKRTPGKVQSPSATGDLEDFFAPSGPKAAVKSPVKQRSKSSGNISVCSLFAVEALLNATVPSPTLIPAQMIRQRPTKGPGGLHVMELPKGNTWDETVSCLSPACDIILLVAGGSEMSMLPGSCLAPTIRRETPPDASDSQTWHRWTVDTCSELLDVLRSPIVAGGETRDAVKLAALQKSLFCMTTFVVPRGHAVSF